MESRLFLSATYHSGPLISSVKVDALYFGSWWSQYAVGPSPQSTAFVTLNDFLAHITDDTFMDQLGEYNAPNYTIGHGSFDHAAVDVGAGANGMSDQTIQNALKNNIFGGDVARPDKNRLYVVFTPPGVEVDKGSLSNKKKDFGGYHSHFSYGDEEVFYAVVCDYIGVNANGAIAMNLSLTEQYTSHELAEAVTDPWTPGPKGGWYDDAQVNSKYGGEIGDLPEAYYENNENYLQSKIEGSYYVQPIWSNKINLPLTLQTPSVSRGLDHVLVTWTPVPFATDYKVVRSDGFVFGWLTSEATQWYDWGGAAVPAGQWNGLVPGVHYTYTIVAAFGSKDANNGTDYSKQEPVGAASGYEKDYDVAAATAGTFSDHIVVTWTPVPFATDYKVVRSDGFVFGWLTSGATHWYDWYGAAVPAGQTNRLLPGVSYVYTVVAAFGPKDANNGTDYSQQRSIGSATGFEKTAVPQPIRTTVSISSSQNPAASGAPVIFTATVADAGPTGTVTFFDGTAQLGDPVTVSGGIAMLTTSSLATLNHAITAVYSGDSVIASSTSALLSQIVNPRQNLSAKLVGLFPSVAIAGIPLKLKGMLGVTAESAVSGSFSSTLLLSPNEDAADSVLTLTSAAGNVKLKKGKNRNFNLGFRKSVPVTVPAGTYHLLIQLMDTTGTVATIDSGQILKVVAPVVDITGSFIKVPTSVTLGREFTVSILITNSSAANVAAIGTLPFKLDGSPDGQIFGLTPLSSGKKGINLKPGKSIKITITGTITSSEFLLVNLDPGEAAFSNDLNPANNSFATMTPIPLR
ncbi:MAG: hypothetical protein JWN24_2353 [Phycisphaerales bacterium]|nr:hypothetical protein [Phycisphaerales bacterium]